MNESWKYLLVVEQSNMFIVFASSASFTLLRSSISEKGSEQIVTGLSFSGGIHFKHMPWNSASVCPSVCDNMEILTFLSPQNSALSYGAFETHPLWRGIDLYICHLFKELEEHYKDIFNKIWLYFKNASCRISTATTGILVRFGFIGFILLRLL